MTYSQCMIKREAALAKREAEASVMDYDVTQRHRRTPSQTDSPSHRERMRRQARRKEGRVR